ncbi:MAG: S49 family peptidase [Halodesulfurarchaeum sp.]
MAEPGGSDILEGVRSGDGWKRLVEILGEGPWSFVIFAVVGLIVGLQLAPMASTAFLTQTSGTVAVIPLAGSINGANAAAVTEQLETAREDPDIQAVVLRVNSPGGGAAASETLYMAVNRTARQMPVVVSVDSMAASGAYYAAAPADYIYAKPSSLVGSIGVIFTAPPEIHPMDRIIATGPNKISGSSTRGWYYKIDTLQNAFLQAVISNRGEQLTVRRARLATAALFSGPEAVRYGLADDIGSIEDATDRAARLAGLERYRTERLDPNTTVTFVTRATALASTVEPRVLRTPRYLVGSSGTGFGNILMVPPELIGPALRNRTGVNATNGTVAASG